MMWSLKKLFPFIILLFIPLVCFPQNDQNKSNVSGGLDIRGMYDNSKPVIKIDYETETNKSSVLMVDVLVTITDFEGLEKVVIDDQVIQTKGQKEYQRVIKTPNKHILVVSATDINRNQSDTTSYIQVSSTYLASKKLALVIGNSSYQHSAPLKNPRNDAFAMTSTLKDLGFEVITETDATKEEMMDALKEFSSKLLDVEIALFYYAGHGIQVKGKNYLIPVDAQYKNGETDVEFESVNVEMLTKVMDTYIDSSDRLNLLILDACRNNPYRTWSRGGEEGLANMSAPSGTLVAFSTAPGSVAADGDGENGLYTGELIKQLRISQRIEDVFINTRNAVERLSNGQQSPWELARLKGRYFLK